MEPTQRMAACGWLMIGVPITDPNTPGLVMVKVPFWTSSGLSFLARARSPRSLIARARPSSDSSSACLITGTMSPQSSATAMPRLMSRRRMVLSPETAALSAGCLRSVSAAAFAMKARKVRFTPRSAYSFFFLARSWATRV